MSYGRRKWKLFLVLVLIVSMFATGINADNLVSYAGYVVDEESVQEDTDAKEVQEEKESAKEEAKQVSEENTKEDSQSVSKEEKTEEVKAEAVSEEKDNARESKGDSKTTVVKKVARKPALKATPADASTTSYTMEYSTNGGSSYSALTSGVYLKNGDKIRGTLNFTLPNTDNTTTEFELDLGQIYNLSFAATSKDLEVEGLGVVGQYIVQGDKIKITLTNDEFINQTSSRRGGLKLDGTVRVDDNNAKYGDTMSIGISGYTTSVKFDDGVPDSDATVYKSTVGSVDPATMTQTFQCSVTAYYGSVKNISLTDTADSGLSEMSAITITDKGGLALADSYASISALNAALAGKTLTKENPIKFTYTMKVDNDAYKQQPTGSYSNKINLSFTNNHETPSDSSAWNHSSSCTVNVNKPTVTKQGTTSEDGKTISWTIKVNLGDKDTYSSGDVKTYLSSVLDNFQDTLGAGCTESGSINLSAMNVSRNGSEYTLTYTTHITTEYQEKISPMAINNSVSFGVDGNTYSTSGATYTNGNSWISKEFSSYDPDTKILSWDVTLSNIPSNISNVFLKDSISEGNHAVDKITFNSKVVVNNGALTSDGSNIFEVLYKNGSEYSMKFKDSVIAGYAGQTLVFHVDTKVNDASINGKKYKNYANISYHDDVANKDTYFNDEAKYEKTSYLKKTGTPVTGKNAIDYSVETDLKSVYDLNSNGFDKDDLVNLSPTVFVFTDVYDSSMQIDLSTVKAYFKGNDTRIPIDSSDVTKTVNEANHKITFNVKLTPAMVSYIQTQYQWHIASLSAIVEYRAKVKDEEAFTLAGETKNFKNTAKVSMEGVDLGDDEVVTSLTPAKLAEKSSDWLGDNPGATKAEKRTVRYTVEINPQKFDLASGDTITVQDAFASGAHMTYDMSSLKVYKNTGAGWTQLSTSEFKVIRDMNSTDMRLQLPDETYLKVVYDAKLDLAYLLTENKIDATNNFRIEDVGGIPSNTSDHIQVSDCDSDGWIQGANYGITIYKYWTNDYFQGLPGAKFKVVRMKLEGGQLVEETGANAYSKIIDTPSNAEGKVLVSGLVSDIIYALYEVTAPNGYKQNTEPYYFTSFSDESHADLSPYAGYNIHTFTNGARLDYNDDKTTEAAGKLKLTKTFSSTEDALTWNDIKSKIKFSVKNSAGTEVASVDGTDLTVDGTVHSYTVNNLTPGNYTVTETNTAISGYSVSTKYKVGTALDVTGTTTSTCTVASNATLPVVFSNTYTETAGKLIITKTIDGEVTKEEAEGALKFKVTAPDGSSQTYGLDMFDYDATTKKWTLELPAIQGTYKVEETTYDINGYAIKSVTSSINGGASVDCKDQQVSVPVAIASTGKVDFADEYDTLNTVLLITKTIEGDVTKEEAEGALKFKVTAPDGSSKTYGLNEFTYSATDNKWTLKLPAVEGSYKVEETTYDVNGYAIKSVTSSVNGGTSADCKDQQVAVPVVLGETGKVDFADEYETLDTLLIITKTIEGDVTKEEAEGALKFKVTAPDGSSKTYGLDEFTYSANTKKWTLKLAAVEGTYKVEETIYDINGYEIVSVTYDCGNDVAVDGKDKTASVSVVTGSTSQIDYKDTYEKSPEPEPTPTITPAPTPTITATPEPTDTPDDVTTDDDDDSDDSDDTDSSSDSPKTSDEFQGMFIFYLVMLGVSGLGLAILYFDALRRRKKLKK